MYYYRLIILILLLLVLFLVGLSIYFYNQIPDKPIHIETVIKEKPGTVEIESKTIEYTAPAQKIIARPTITASGRVNEVALDSSLFGSGFFKNKIDTNFSLPLVYTAIHDTTIIIEHKLNVLLDDSLKVVADSSIFIKYFIKQQFFYPENNFYLFLSTKHNILNINLFEKTNIYQKKLEWYLSSEFRYLSLAVGFVGGIYLGTQISK